MEKRATRPAKSFLDLTVQQRIEALTSGTSNNFGKSLALYVMKRGMDYTRSELEDAATDFLQMDLPFVGVDVLSSYCNFSLQPIGFAVEKKVVRESRWSRRRLDAYEITEDGERLGKPSIERFLLIADYLQKPLHVINGNANPGMHGAIRHGYVMARVLEALSDGNAHTRADISGSTGIAVQTTVNALRKLAKLGLVDYASTKASTDVVSGHAKFEARIREDGMMCYEFAYKPVILVSENPTAPYVYREYRNVFPDRSAVAAAFRTELRRFADTSSHLHRQSATDSTALVLDAIKKTGLERFRRKDVAEIIEKGDDRRNIDSMLSHFLRILRNKGAIKETDQLGYYELTEPEQKD